MAIPATGAVSFSDLRTEFVGGSSAISYSDLYLGGSNIRTKAVTTVRKLCRICANKRHNYFGRTLEATAKAFRYTYTLLAQPIKGRDFFGDDYAVNYPKEIVINAGVELGATSTSEEALELVRR